MSQPQQARINFFAPVVLLLLISTGTIAEQNGTEVPPLVAPDWSHEILSLQMELDSLKATLSRPLPNSVATATSSPVYPTAKLTGFFQADAIFANQSRANMEALGMGVASDGDIQDGADFRRARLAASGKVWDNVSYMLEMDFAFPGHPSFMDVWLDIEDVVGNANIRIGQFRQPFGMDALTSVKDLTFFEQGLPFAMLPFRQIGVMAYGTAADEDVTWAVSGFRFPTDVYGGNIGDNGSYGISSRLTAVLFDFGNNDGLIHLGAGHSFVDPANDRVQYRKQPEVFVGENGGALAPPGVPNNLPPFVDTGAIATDQVNLLNAELAMSYQSFYMQSEAFVTNVNQQAGPSLTFPGAYTHAGYFLTGEHREYSRTNAVFTRVKPLCSVGKDGGIGAWEVAGRWSYLDLNDNNIKGGKLNNLSAGLNWYLNPNTKFQVNYIHSLLNTPFNGDSQANLFAFRAQIDF